MMTIFAKIVEEAKSSTPKELTECVKEALECYEATEMVSHYNPDSEGFSHLPKLMDLLNDFTEEEVVMYCATLVREGKQPLTAYFKSDNAFGLKK